ncbi:radical sam [Lucifera butyrica]|uniref:Heme chaperone HemW n=1 Tax=Lucifera butyrica TaxID=1351585 RepID=A0A498R753_9FIRM|nr:radical SAM family heme chaperone HemW [Lucifera butyrica]VBB06102.1 radical sam [Lucifera butyrica]
MKIGLYIHIPFCAQKCLYCDFTSYVCDESVYADYVAALCRECAMQGGPLANAAVDSLYIGGGTPTILPGRLLEQTVACVRKNFRLDEAAEISIEANPGTVNKEKLALLRRLGINRISFGVQTFNDRLLQLVGRIHSAREGEQAVLEARKAGFTNISIDLMYGLPEQTVADLESSMRRAANMGVPHVSVYGLKVEEKTAMSDALQAGRLTLPDEDTDDAMYEKVTGLLPQLGYDWYEISNFALPGYECRHNLKYWQYKPYLGLGVAAHSFLKGVRSANVAGLDVYMRQLARNQLPVLFAETAIEKTAWAEFSFLALRTQRGLYFDEFAAQFHIAFIDCFGPVVEDLSRKGLIAVTSAGIRLTLLGRKYGNAVFRSFLP